MNELIKTIKKEDGTIAVSGRDLHEFLKIATEFKKWFGRMTEYGFNENQDYIRVTQKCPTPGGVQDVTDFVMTIDMAKEISMIQRNEKGKRARQYFIEVEKRYKQGQIDMTGLSPETRMAMATAQALANQELKLKSMDTKLDSIADIVGTSTMDWRKSTQHLINRIVQIQGGEVENWKSVRNDIYDEVDRRAGSSLSIRLTNLKRRMAEEGVTKSKRDKTTKVDVIGNDKKLIEIYMAVVKDFAIKYSIWKEEY
ncbi:antA/AntB antirepressor family protein [Lapidilactobacillus wuchangensis]|uniref:antA/AntB antirepressor family protein n=1 Tax=Lapidilactobacillus wuchangensis TaxID=2486001 RepID=UPI000F76C62B|nr:antA/AntB antirepressor family protein [Lapidilactobacillus wuchangensis]